MGIGKVHSQDGKIQPKQTCALIKLFFTLPLLPYISHLKITYHHLPGALPTNVHARKSNVSCSFMLKLPGNYETRDGLTGSVLAVYAQIPMCARPKKIFNHTPPSTR